MEMEAWKASDEFDGVVLLSDSSPDVGCELQGMVADLLFKDSSFRRMTLPGRMLAYGYQTFVYETMALVWTVHLIVGSNADMLSWFFNKVVCVTTDYGVEVLTLLCCDVVPAFVRWLAGEPLHQLHGLVNRNEQLMKFAIRIGGWSHSMGGS